MITRLDTNAYGKNAIKLSKVIRHADRHEIRHISVDVSLKGDFDTVHTLGDNTKVLPTDTMKNTVYALAKDHFTGPIEDFGLVLARHFLSRNPQVDEVGIELTEFCWTRMVFDGQPHPHSFLNGGSEKHVAFVTASRQATRVAAGIRDLLLLKTTDSGFEHYIKDEYTTLKETNDRIFSTECEVSWKYGIPSPGSVAGTAAPGGPGPTLDFGRLYEDIRLNLLQTFATHQSLSVQHTLYAMGENVLAAFGAVTEISLKMPNKHHIPFNLGQFGMENKNEIFIATDEPYGYITGTLVRD